MLHIKKVSPLTGEINSILIDISYSQLNRIDEGVELIQHICPELSREHREFLISGISPEEWNEYMVDI